MLRRVGARLEMARSSHMALLHSVSQTVSLARGLTRFGPSMPEISKLKLM
jgi:hypothetical protein